MFNNKDIYSGVEFDSWANGENLIFAEKFLVNNHLNKSGKTLEAGTGGGRILFELKKLGFDKLYGFDYVPEFIEKAKTRDISKSINFTVQNAVKLGYDNNYFDNLIYLQQVICFIEDENSRQNAIREAYRILKSGGTALFSFLSYEARGASKNYLLYLKYIKTIRSFSGSRLKIQYLPWLKLGNKPNFMALLDKGPYVYWYMLNEIEESLKEAGFILEAIGSTSTINQGIMFNDSAKLYQGHLQGMVYFVCTK